MSPIDDREKKAIELVATAAGGLHEVKKAAKEAAHEKIRESATRAHASKTPKSAQTRKRIIDAACAIMRERGSMDFQMSEVSDRCHMSKGSIYYYFSDKDELISAIFNETFDSFFAELEGAVEAAPDGISALREIGHLFGAACGDSSPFSVGLAAEALTPLQDTGRPFAERLVQLVADQLERAKREGLVRESVNSSTFALFAVGGALLVGLLLPADQCGKKIKDAIDALIDNSVRGIGVQAAPMG